MKKLVVVAVLMGAGRALACPSGAVCVQPVVVPTASVSAAGVHFIMSVRSMDPATMQVFPLDNFPARIAFKTWCAADSTALVGVEDAKDLSRLGEFIFRRGVDRPIRCRMKADEVA